MLYKYESCRYLCSVISTSLCRVAQFIKENRQNRIETAIASNDTSEFKNIQDTHHIYIIYIYIIILLYYYYNLLTIINFQ